MDSVLHKIFELEHKSNRDRARFLSRLFGIFSERIVSNWAKNPRCTYRDLGRPTIKSDIGSGSHTLDFTLQDRNTGKTYICEMKCEIEYLNFKHFVLTNSSHLVHHGKPAFEVFLQSANPDNRHTTFIGKKRIKTDGAILIWGSATPEGRSSVIEAQGFHDVISIEDICSDLINWECAGYVEVVEQLREWSNRLFDGLLGKEVTPSSDAIVSPLFRAAKSIRAPSSSSKNERKESNRTPEQEQVLHELADALGWPSRKEDRLAEGISGIDKRYGQCHFAWVVIETFTRTHGREPSMAERNDLSDEHGLNPGNLRAEHTSWRKARGKMPALPPKP